MAVNQAASDVSPIPFIFMFLGFAIFWIIIYVKKLHKK